MAVKNNSAFDLQYSTKRPLKKTRDNSEKSLLGHYRSREIIPLKVHKRENFLAPILNFILFYS